MARLLAFMAVFALPEAGHRGEEKQAERSFAN
jgi:hypothetical protein